ncbi:MAG: hypothetical protein EA395_03925 [Phormidium sp. GEM2.Bin31]|nr:hypothetical protein [Phormidium sp. BM_Day4_Bin.17]TVR13516.1 MAG: hypothetical protein EA395_03925 [Phormidium sp. GEM2.Bin31]UCJ12450.1 MAG: hypothetical protein JWS08_01065 [Phormidium sp. PBR-2020]
MKTKLVSLMAVLGLSLFLGACAEDTAPTDTAPGEAPMEQEAPMEGQPEGMPEGEEPMEAPMDPAEDEAAPMEPETPDAP